MRFRMCCKERLSLQEVCTLRHPAANGSCIGKTITRQLSYYDFCVWEVLDVSGRGTAPASPALCVGVVL
jgi:hypothetical protein